MAPSPSHHLLPGSGGALGGAPDEPARVSAGLHDREEPLPLHDATAEPPELPPLPPPPPRHHHHCANVVFDVQHHPDQNCQPTPHRQHETNRGDCADPAGAGGGAEYHGGGGLGHSHEQQQQQQQDNTSNHGHGYVQGREGCGPQADGQQWECTQHTVNNSNSNNIYGAQVAGGVHVSAGNTVASQGQHQYAYHPEGQGQPRPPPPPPPPVVEQQAYGGAPAQHQQPYTHANPEHGGGGGGCNYYGDGMGGSHHAQVHQQQLQQQQQQQVHHYGDGTDGTGTYQAKQAQQPQYYQNVGSEALHRYQPQEQQQQQQQQQHHEQYPANNMQHYHPQAHPAYALRADQEHAEAMAAANALHAAATGRYGDGHGYAYQGSAPAATVVAGAGGGDGRRRPQHHTPVPSDEAWERRFQELCEFYREFGHSDVPQTYKRNKPLGKWVGKQRENWKIRQDNESSTLTDERMRKLETVDFKFYMGKGTHAKLHGLYMTERKTEEFNRRFQELVEFKAQHGHCQVPFADPKYNGLAQWCSRFNRKLRSHRITGPSATPLTRPGPSADMTEEAHNNDTNGDQNHSTGDSGDGRAVTAQAGRTSRVSAKEREMRILLERKKKLEDLGGFDFDFGFHRKERVADGPKTNNERWNEKFEALRQYKERVGNADVPSTYREGETRKDSSLAIWVAKQRDLWRNKRRGKGRKLSDEREAKLASLGLNFDINDANWDSKFEELKQYHEKYGTTNVIERAGTRSLWHWCKRQREAFHQFLEDNSGPMTDDHVSKMDQLGFDWKYEKTHENLEAKKARCADQSKNPKGRVGRPKKKGAAQKSAMAISKAATKVTMTAPMVEVDPREIGSIEAALRVAIERYGSHATSADGTSGRREKSNARANPDRWLAMFQQLIQYKKDHGHCKVPQREKGYDGLGLWVKVQRDDYRDLLAKKQSPMCEWRLELLQKISFTFEAANVTTFDAWLEQLRVFKAEFGHTKVPQNFRQNKSLGKWVARMREQYHLKESGKKHRLTEDQIRQLDSVGFQWRVGQGKARRSWDECYQDLIKFHQEHGHFNVPINYAPNPSLASWAKLQRSNYRSQVLGKNPKGKSVREQNQKLIDIGYNFHVDPAKGGVGGEELPSRKRKHAAPATKSGGKEETVGGDEATSSTCISETRKPAAKRAKRSDSIDQSTTVETVAAVAAVDEDGPLPPSHNGL